MFVVAIAVLGTTSEQEAQPLAVDLGTTAFDTRLLLARGLPVTVLRTSDKGRALDLLARLRARRHQAVAFDSAAVVSSAAMVRPRDLSLDAHALRAESGALAYSNVLALIHGTQPTRTEAVHTTTHRQIDLKGAVLTGGLKLTKKVTKEHHVVTDDREQFLFVFPRPPSPPWRLDERGLHYQCLGAEMTTNQMENFRKVVARLRSHATTARYDDSLLRFAKASPDKLGEQTIDEQAHLIALCTAKGLLGDGPPTTAPAGTCLGRGCEPR